MDHERLARWIADYERAWRTPGTGALADLFAPHARYSPAPFAQTVHGLPAIATFWEAERDGPDEVFSLAWAPVAVQDDVAVARVEVRYAGPPTRHYRDLWVIELDERGRCRSFEEWPFFPGQARAAERSRPDPGGYA